MDEDKSQESMSTKCRCTQCGWEGDYSQCYNGEYEPPTCLMCESSSLIMIIM